MFQAKPVYPNRIIVILVKLSSMKKLIIVVPAGQNNLSSVVGPYKFFTKANEYAKKRDKMPVFDVQLAGISEKEELYDGLFSIKPHTNIRLVERADLVIIPAQAHHNLLQLVAANDELINWLKEQYRLGAEIASICTGAFLLASTGLLDGKSLLHALECSRPVQAGIPGR